MTVQTWLPDVFHYLVQNNNFHCQMPLKMPNLTYLAVKNASWQNLVANKDSLIVTVVQATGCIFRQF